MPKLYYAGNMFELSANEPGEDLPSRMNDAIAAGRDMVGISSIPAGMTLGMVELANGNSLIFSLSGSAPMAIESEKPVPTRAQ